MKRLLAIGLLASASVFGFDSDTDNEPDGAVFPEPATIGLIGAGLAAFGFAAWRKNRKR